MEGDGNSSSIRVLLVSVATRLPGQPETVTFERGKQTPRLEGAEPAVVDLGHTVIETSGSS